MKTFLLFITLLFSLDCYAQHIKVAPDGSKVIISYDTDGYHKNMYVLHGPDSTCGDIIAYDPDVQAKKDNKYDGLNFKNESNVISKLLGIASDYRPHMLCTWMISILSYDDLLVQQIKAFENSGEWQAYIAAHKTGPYDMQLITSIITNANVLQPLDELLKRAGYKIGNIYLPEEIKDIVPEKELKRLGKNKKLIIPQVDPVWIQLVHK